MRLKFTFAVASAVVLAGCGNKPKATASEPSLQETQVTPKQRQGNEVSKKLMREQRKQRQANQSLQETQRWMHDFVADQGFDGLTFEGKDCSAVITFSDEIGTSVSFSFKDLDPNTATSVYVEVARSAPRSVFMVKAETTNGLKKVVAYDSLSKQTQQSWVEILFRSAEDADRFAKALHHAIVLCGGKPSAF